MKHFDTICAVTTPPGSGALAGIRLSGPETKAIITSIFVDTKGKKQRKLTPLRVYKGYLKDQNILDEVVLFIDRKPNTYTGEDTAEIYFHNNQLIADQIISLLISRGARLAEPGEFTKRRLLNGKMDLTQAEGLVDLYAAETEPARRQALRQHLGEERVWVENLCEQLKSALTGIEMELDFQHEKPAIKRDIKAVKGQIERAIGRAQYGIALKNGVRIGIIGDPNVGKSALFNALLGKERAIVHRVPGTTRDVIVDHYFYKGIKYCLFDTAGKRKTRSRVESIGQKKALEWEKTADMVLHVIDVSKDKYTKSGRKRDKGSVNVNKGNANNELLIYNKIDLVKGHRIKGIKTSATKGVGVQKLKEIIHLRATGKGAKIQEILVTNQRHIQCLKRAENALQEALKIDEPELIAVSLNQAIGALEEISGNRVNDQIIKAIFDRFCVGK